MPTPTANATLTNPNQALQQLQAAYGSTTHEIAQSVATGYFAHLTMVEVISAIISTALIAASIYFLIQTGWIANRVDRVRDVVLKKSQAKKHAQSSWEDIERHFFAGDDNDLKVALIEADNLLDEALQDAGVPGTTLGERLQRVNEQKLPNVEDVWQAHKVRNRIAHEANFVLKRDLAERALTVYEKALEHLGLLDAEVGITTPGGAGQAGNK